MRILQTPTEPIFYDAWSIAHAYLTKNDAEVFLSGKNTTYKTKMLLAQVNICEALIEERTANWFANYGTEKSWKQYLDGHPRYETLQNLLGVSA
jgi:hypothetical protein